MSQRGCAIKTYGGTQGVNGEGGAACVSCAHDSQDVRTSTHEGSGADSAAGAAADPSLLRLTFFEFTIADWACCDKERFFLTLPLFFGGMALLARSQNKFSCVSLRIGRKSRKSRKVGPLLWHVPRERPKVPASFGHRTTTLALASWARGAVPEDIPQNQRVSCCRSLKPTPPPSLQRLQAVGLGSQARARARASRVRPWCRGRRPCAPAARWLARRAHAGRLSLFVTSEAY